MKLTHLSDKQLLTEALYWSNKEREALGQVLWRLKEIDQRKLYCDLKCSGLYDYCLSILKYSEGQASRRVAACRLLVSLPEIIVDIEKGDLNLTQLNQAKTFFDDQKITDPEEKKSVLEKLKGKTTRESERMLWEIKKDEGPRKVSLTLLEETVLELKKVQSLKAHACPDMDSLLKRMMVDVKEVWDPRIVKRKRTLMAGDSRYVQMGVKAQVWERDKGKCHNCGSSHALELDHIHPYALGGKTTVENLRLLCRACNQRRGIVAFGKRVNSRKGPTLR